MIPCSAAHIRRLGQIRKWLLLGFRERLAEEIWCISVSVLWISYLLPIYGLITNVKAFEHQFSVYVFKKIKFDLSPTNHLSCHSEISRARSGYCYSFSEAVSGTFVRVKMADNSTDKGPWTKMLESFIRYVALNPKEFLLYGN